MVQVVAVTNHFIAQSPSSIEAVKSATLLQGLQINALIYGPLGCGKKTLATTILSDAPIVRADNFLELLDTIKESSEIIVTHFETLPNSEQLKDALEKNGTRLIATSSADIPLSLYNEFFSIKIDLLPLSERPEDVELLCKKFFDEHSDITGEVSEEFSPCAHLDLSKNAHSLKRSVLVNALFKSISEDELINIMESFFDKNLPLENGYRDSLHLFDIPLIRSGLKKHKSQLKLSEVLGINRNTLRKKILQYKEELDNE